MTIVVTSRIQHRRGIRSDLPTQLSEGELGWCLDTRQLFIGNSDGFGDNTEIITQFSQDVLSNVNVLANNTTFARVLATRFADVYNLKDFGAKGDGSDATSALQQAINVAGSYSTIFAPPGIYGINSVSVLDGIEIQGAGTSSTIFRSNANNTVMFDYASGNTTGFGITFKNLQIDTVDTQGCTAIRLDGGNTAVRVQDVRLQNLNIVGNLDTGIILKYAVNGQISDVFINQVANGVRTETCADLELTTVKVQNGSGVGFYILGDNDPSTAFDQGIRLQGCSTLNQSQGIYIKDQQRGIATACSFTTAINGPCVIENSNSWKFSSCEFACGSNVNASVSTDSTSFGIMWTNSQFVLGSFGLILRGNTYSVTNSWFTDNEQPDIWLDAEQSTIGNNMLQSTGNINSVQETINGNCNVLSGNITRGNIFIMGPASISANNVIC